jgi:hypothetical protein
MNIIFDIDDIDAIKNNSVVLELDTFYFAKLNKTATAYCVVDNIKITDFDNLEPNQQLHAKLIAAYKKKDFKLCRDLLEHLIGAFNGEVDSFYLELTNRISNPNTDTVSEDWTSVIVRED